MTDVTWIEDVSRISGQRILIDTNIWIMIEGFNEGAPQKKVNAYSGAYEALLRNGNTVLYNEHIVNEFCNTCARIEFNAHLVRSGRQGKMSFKEFRKTDAFLASMQLIREACMTIVEECDYAPFDLAAPAIPGLVDEICQGRLDFTDILIRNFCLANGAHLLTDDADFRGSGARVITSNRRFMGG